MSLENADVEATGMGCRSSRIITEIRPDPLAQPDDEAEPGK